MKLILTLIAIVISVTVGEAVSAVELVGEEWNSFKVEHGKSYASPVEEKFRLNIYVDNRNKIALHNQKYAQGEVSFKLKLNKYADMLHHEFVDTMNGYNRSLLRTGLQAQKYDRITFLSPANVEFPESIDWRTKGAVTAVKDQGHCGSCWSFSTTGSLEGQNFRKTGALVSLSEQNLIDCSTKYGNQGCSGGIMDNAYQYIKDNNGIDTEKTYPYEAKDDTCRYNAANAGARDRGFADIPANDEDKLKHAVATIGPVSVAIDASHESFQFYADGIYFEPQCTDQLDHAVLAVGYGTDEKGQDYWLVKNSWGTTWGDQGYVRMARNKNNHCGIASMASYPLV